MATTSCAIILSSASRRVSLKTECNNIKDALAYYNESNDCDGGDYTSGAVLPLSSSKTPAQGQSWGSVKASYQDNNK